MNLLISQVVPRSLINELRVSQAANNFCWDLIDNHCFSKNISMVPINVPKKINNENNDDVKYLQVRFFWHKSIFKYINALIENIIVVFHAFKSKGIWYYNITSYNMLSFILLRYLFRKKIYVIVADFSPPTRKISLQQLVSFYIENSSGVILLSARSNFKHKNMEVIPGIIPINKITKLPNVVRKKGNRHFLFSGVLNLVTGFPMVLQVFKSLPDVDLFISGNIDNDYAHLLIDKYPNIHYCGLLSYKDYLEMLKTTDICLSFRDPSLPENNNNFPSKILEYFSWGKPVISTIEYPELKGLNYITVQFEEKSLIAVIKQVHQMKNSELAAYMNNFNDLEQLVSEKIWKKAINKIETYL